MLGQFPARSFEELFQGVRAIPWEEFLPREAAFPVKGYSISSQLHSVPACQSIIKKAVVERLKAHYGMAFIVNPSSSTGGIAVPFPELKLLKPERTRILWPQTPARRPRGPRGS